MDIEAVLAALLRELLARHGFRLPVTVASVGRNGAVLFTRFTAAPSGSARGAVEQEHVTGEIEDEGFLAPVHLLATDATGKARLAVQRRHGPPLVLDTAEPDEG
ncbi:MAG: hypothetical protein KC501_24485 [Myxococcales bacterium]|nr:hypothetical protein [Myxococcales bacterium]